jgi:hypothetical protein
MYDNPGIVPEKLHILEMIPFVANLKMQWKNMYFINTMAKPGSSGHPYLCLMLCKNYGKVEKESQ